jgi:O-antigen ligase
LSLSAVLFVLAFGAGCVLAFTRHPVFGTAAYVGTFFLSPQLRWWGQGLLYNVRWSFIAAAVTLIAIFVSKKAQKPAIPFTKHGVVWLFLFFIFWILVQGAWALDQREHADLASYYLKFTLAFVMIYYTIDSASSLRVFMWTYVFGCFYFGWVAYTTYTGGRFEGFGGAGINEANAGALTIVTGTLLASSLFLDGKWRERGVLMLMIPFMLNGLVTTISRSGFLALTAGGLVFLYFAPKKYRKQIGILSLLALVLFLMLTGPTYWKRMRSLEHAGETVQGVDTGQDRLAIIKVQWKLFAMHPLGCGATCTTVLSKNYLDKKYLAETADGVMRRASHNTYMTIIVDHGIPGVFLWGGMWLWVAVKCFKLGKAYRKQGGFEATAFPSIAAIFAALAVGDMFVTYGKYEIRVWMIAVVMALLSIETARVKQEKLAGAPVPAAGPSRKTAALPSPAAAARPVSVRSESRAAGDDSRKRSGSR